LIAIGWSETLDNVDLLHFLRSTPQDFGAQEHHDCETFESLILLFGEIGGYVRGSYRGVDFVVANNLIDPLGGGASWVHKGDRLRCYGVVELPEPLLADMRVERKREAFQPEVDELEQLFTWTATSDEIVKRALSGSFLNALRELCRTHAEVVVTDRWLGYGPLEGDAEQIVTRLDKLIDALPGIKDVESRAAKGDELVHFRRAAGMSEAEEWAGQLLAAGVQCRIHRTLEWAGGESASGEVELMVPRKALELATNVLDEDVEDCDQPFCYFCGATLQSSVQTCPECGQDLTEDED